MILEGCVRRDDKMNLEGPHAYFMFISIGILPLEMMSVDAHSMTSRLFMGRMTLWSFVDLRTLLQISLI